MVGMPSLCTTRQVKICSTTGARCRVQGEAGLGAALAGFGGDGVRDPVGEVAVGGGADVPPVQGVLDQAFPGFLLQLQPEPFGDALFHPPDQHRGRVDALDDGGLVGGEQRDPLPGQLLLQFQGVEGVPAGPLDVLADHRGELRGRGRRPRRAGRPSRRRGGCPRRRRARPVPRPRASRSRPPDSMSQYQAVMNHPRGARPGRRGSAGSARRGGLASPGWRCGPGTRPGPAPPGPASRTLAAEAASLRGVVCAGVAIGVPP